MSLPREIENHLKALLHNSESPWAQEEGSWEKLKATWEEKDRLFQEQVRLLGMDEYQEISLEDTRALLILTYSGSLISLGSGESTWMEYASIKLRSDVPDILRGENVRCLEGPVTSKALNLEGGPVKNTSALYRIAACKEGVSPEEQEKRIREATIFLTNSFVKLNRSLTQPRDTGLDQFNKANIVAYLARKNGLTQKKAKELLEDYQILIESALMLQHPVNLGRLGKLDLKKKAPRKARLGRNPKTGEEITIPARDAHWAPDFRFSSYIKDRVEALPLGEED